MLVVLPFSSKCWRETLDPEPEGPAVCIVHEFPSDITHTIHWAKLQLAELFCEGEEGPTAVNEVLKGWVKEGGDLQSHVNSSTQASQHVIKKLLCYMTRRPTSFADCVTEARSKFDQYYFINIQNLLIKHPLGEIETYKMPDGTEAQKMFWSLPRREPELLPFDPLNKMCSSFVWSFANLYARMFKLVGTDGMDEMSAAQMAADCAPLPSADQPPEKQAEPALPVIIEQLMNERAQLCGDDYWDPHQAEQGVEALLLKEDGFEKDDDSNFHVEFLTAASNLRARLYKIVEEDFFKTKLIAGKIIPAIATTTSVVSGLVCIEMIKIMLKKPKDEIRDSQVNLALPMLALFEPDNPRKNKLGHWEFSMWDRLEVTQGPNVTLQHMLDHLGGVTGLVAQDVYRLDNQHLVYKGAKGYKGLHGWKLQKKLVELLDLDPTETASILLRVVFYDVDGEPVKIANDVEAPPVNITFSSGGYKLMGNTSHPAVLPVLCLFAEANISYEQLPEDDSSTVILQDGGLLVRGTDSILRYICGKHALERWYPCGFEDRAQVDMALEFARSAMSPMVSQVLLPVLAGEEPVDAAAVIAKLMAEPWVPWSSGKFITAADLPTIGDIVIAQLIGLCGWATSYDHFTSACDSSSDLLSYCQAVAKSGKQWDSCMLAAQVVYAGFMLRVRTPQGFEEVAFARNSTLAQLYAKLSEISGLALDEMAIRFGGSLNPQPVNLLGYPGCTECDPTSSMASCGIGPQAVVLVSARSELQKDELTHGAPPLLRTGSGKTLSRMPSQHIQCPVCYKIIEQHLIATHAGTC